MNVFRAIELERHVISLDAFVARVAFVVFLSRTHVRNRPRKSNLIKKSCIVAVVTYLFYLLDEESAKNWQLTFIRETKTLARFVRFSDKFYASLLIFWRKHLGTRNVVGIVIKQLELFSAGRN